jgi:tetratricopeptide (TPR) repeat protein
VTKTLLDAIELRKQNKSEEALKILATLLKESPYDPELNYQMAWTCDSLGKESEAVPFYETALANGLQNDRRGALLGLGSTYRCLGHYQKSLKVFDQAVAEFPDDRALRVFRALTLYNLGKYDHSISDLLVHLLDTTTDNSIKSYDRALRYYADKLDQTWK